MWLKDFTAFNPYEAVWARLGLGCFTNTRSKESLSQFFHYRRLAFSMKLRNSCSADHRLRTTEFYPVFQSESEMTEFLVTLSTGNNHNSLSSKTNTNLLTNIKSWNVLWKFSIHSFAQKCHKNYVTKVKVQPKADISKDLN